MTVATLIGQSADLAATLFRSWASQPDPPGVDRFCTTLRANAPLLPLVYYCEWIDRWLMGDEVPGPGSVDGQHYQATCLSREETAELADRGRRQFAEEEWLAARLSEAANVWCPAGVSSVVIVVREVLEPSATDQETQAAAGVIPDWLICFGEADSGNIK
ncbi:hypothetical protein [Fimbriiglobus ruber]|uniref:hypothetical protein n=1 Tax=Fimbriiglobus ruber TaxID=1908690 RepID=UPI001EE731D5|nr:hypothetical protein [Fimbriiglobus ruber]